MVIAHPTHQVLLIDPEPEIRATRALFLQMHNMTVQTARGSASTLERLRAGFRPCAVVADPRRAGIAAWELVDWLRHDSVLCRVPLVLVCGEALQWKSARWHGVAECLPKPALPASIIAAIERRCMR